jgi:hypothetical protein
MKSTIRKSIYVSGMFIALHASRAFAGSISDCGDIDVEAKAKCELMAEGGCNVEKQCTLLACSASLYAQCKGECEALPDVECTGSCKTDCSADCKVAADFDCSGNCSSRCTVECGADCSAKCSDSECEAKCQGTCDASCQGECNEKCNLDANASCEAKCEGSCSGSCTVKSNLGCQLDCRVDGDAKCQSDCEIACEKPNAALFCDGQFIDHGGNLESCVAAINDWISEHVQVDATAEGSAACNHGTCTAEGSAKASANASCAMSKTTTSSSGIGFGLLGVVTTGFFLRRRRRLGA